MLTFRIESTSINIPSIYAPHTYERKSCNTKKDDNKDKMQTNKQTEKKT